MIDLGYIPMPQEVYGEWLHSDEKYGNQSVVPYYKSHNKGMGNVLTLSNGRYDEFITLPKQINVGGAVYHTRQRKIVSWNKNRPQAVLPPDVVGNRKRYLC